MDPTEGRPSTNGITGQIVGEITDRVATGSLIEKVILTAFVAATE